MKRSLLVLSLLAPLASASTAEAQQKLPPVRPLGPVIARSTEPLGAVSAAVPLPDGRVLVNDILQRRVVMFDSLLKSVIVVADTTAATGNAYGARGGGLIGYAGDSALFIDPVSLTMMVVNPKGELTTVRAVPRANDIGFLAGGPNGRPGFAPDGKLVYRGQARLIQPGREARPTVGNFVMPQQPDSAPIVRVDFATRKLDTVATIKIPKVDLKASQGNDGRMSVQVTQNPMASTDDWALLSDGTIALVRQHDFHVDWVAPDGQVTSSPKLPFEWERMSDEQKQQVIDSARVAIEKQREEARRLMNAAGGPQAFIQGGGAERMIVMGGAGGAPPQRGQAQPAQGAQPAAPGGAQGQGRAGEGRGPGPGGPGGFQMPPVNLIPANELPDYRPPFTQGSALGDLDGLLWVRTTSPVGEGGPIYYVINKQNEVVDRVQVPQGRIIAGFGKGGIIYLGFRDAEGTAHLEWARWK